MNNTIGLLVGSLRRESFSKKLAKAIALMAPDGFEFRTIPLDDLPVYNQDFDDEDRVPESYVAFRSAVAAVAGIVFITPEYNRSVPGVLKNALDIGSRPMGSSVWDGKPAAVFSNSPGDVSAFGANQHLRQSLVHLNMPTMQQPEVYIAGVDKIFDDNGELKAGDTRDFIQQAVDAYVAWFNRLQGWRKR